MLRRQLRVQEKLGAALYGNVWLCEDVDHNDQLVAVKQVSINAARMALAMNQHMDNPWNERRITRLIQSLGGHEHLLSCPREFVENGSWFLVMEYCEGGDLLDVLQASPDCRLPEMQAMHYFMQVADAVQFLHANGIAHRDLSLENVLLQNGSAKICDFGLSTEADRITNERVGKAYYMAPEVVAEEEYHPVAADMWSLGMMLFIMITGSPLSPSASVEEKAFIALKQHGVSKIIDAWGMGGMVSTSIKELLTGLLQIDPAKRWTMDEVIQHVAP